MPDPQPHQWTHLVLVQIHLLLALTQFLLMEGMSLIIDNRVLSILVECIFINYYASIDSSCWYLLSVCRVQKVAGSSRAKSEISSSKGSSGTGFNKPNTSSKSYSYYLYKGQVVAVKNHKLSPSILSGKSDYKEFKQVTVIVNWSSFLLFMFLLWYADERPQSWESERILWSLHRSAADLVSMELLYKRFPSGCFRKGQSQTRLAIQILAYQRYGWGNKIRT